MVLITLGGWLLVSFHFNLDKHERVLTGLGLGLVIFLWLSNALGRWLPPSLTFLVSGLIVFAAGLIPYLRRSRPALSFSDWNIPVWLIMGLVLGWMFLRVSIGTGMFDEYKNLALISTLANGTIPALEYFGRTQLLLYHYGFHLLGASMMQIGHFYPWSAFDLSKAIIWSLSVLMAALAGKRFLKTNFGAVLTGTVMALAGGTRYLLLLLPSSILQAMDANIHLFASSGATADTLSQSLTSTWVVQSGPPVGYPFAFLSGINPPYVIAHGGETTLALLMFMLALLLLTRGKGWSIILFSAVLFSFWALGAETDYVLFAIAWAVAFGIRLIRRIRTRTLTPEVDFVTLGLLISMPLALIEGGTISALAQKIFSILLPHAQTAVTAVDTSAKVSAFSFQWPPAILSAHLGPLPIFNLLSLIVAIVEIGPVVLFLPWLTYDWFKNRSEQDWLNTILLLISWIGLLIAIFFRWDSSPRDITRIPAFASKAATLLLIYRVDQLLSSGKITISRPLFMSAFAALALMCISGGVLGAVQLSAAQQVVLTDHYGDKEAMLLKDVWGRLPRDGKMFGPIGKASILTGQLTGGIIAPPPGAQRQVWTTLNTSPTLDLLLQNKINFVFVDSAWWRGLSHDSQKQLKNSCITVFAQSGDDTSPFFLKILDLRNCH